MSLQEVGGLSSPVLLAFTAPSQHLAASPPGDPSTDHLSFRNSAESIHNLWQKCPDICLTCHALCSGGRAEAEHHFVSQLLFLLAFLHGSLHAVVSQIHLNLLCCVSYFAGGHHHHHLFFSLRITWVASRVLSS